MQRSFLLLAALAAPAAVLAQAAPSATAAPAAVTILNTAPDPSAAPTPFAPTPFVAALTQPTFALPDAPSTAVSSSAEPAVDAGPGNLQGNVAPRYANVILPGQTAVPLHGHEKAVLGLHDAFNVYQLAGITLSAGWSHLIDSAPHYGTDAPAFGQRVGAAAIRSTVQTLATDAVFSPMFHDDPRYYELGPGHKFVDRVVYAATRVVITRSSNDGHSRFNAPLLLGYATAAGVNNAYYPQRDRTGSQTAQSFGTSLVGAALGFEVNEFLDDALRIVHLRK